MQLHDDGSVSVLLQGPHQGCHVQLQGLLARADLNGCFGYVCGACEAATQRWPVRVTLPDGDTKVVSLKADNLVCSRQVMARDGNGGLCAVPAFASDWLTRQRPGAEVLRFRREDVEGVRAEGVVADVKDSLCEVAAAVGSSGLVEVDKTTRTLGMHQLLQQAVRAELGDAHDDAMAALLEARCGCMGDADDGDERMYGVMREVVGAAGHVVGRMKAAAGGRAAWACSMRLRVLETARTVLGAQSLEALSFHDAVDAELSALGVVEGRPAAVEYRAMDWLSRSFRGSEVSLRALISEVEAALASAPDAAAGWDCKAALSRAEHMAGMHTNARGQYDRAIEFYERALRIQTATLGEMHASTAATITSMGASYSEKGQHDRAIELYERALRIRTATLGEMHADTAGTISSMGASYSKKGQDDRAIELTERALRICHQALGPHHPQTQKTEQNLANARSKAARQTHTERGRR
jgi:tetratricopeptide (TPR) repeat protein